MVTEGEEQLLTQVEEADTARGASDFVNTTL